MSALAAPPTRLGRFELRRQLGRGAQASVWLAFDPRLEREVAVKLMHMGATAATAGAWLQEARSVSRLNHPHIVPLFEADMHGQQAYLVFEYVAGRTLAEHLRAKGAMAPRDAVQLMIPVLDALESAHAAGVIHRDLKPSNILLDAQGRARVMDFGIAARATDAAHQQVVGTPGYLSPEATQGVRPSAAMDVFSAGLVLAELLAGRPVIPERDPIRALYRVAHEDLPLPDGMPPEADDALRAIVQRAIARDPSRRHPSAQELGDALRQWLHPKAVMAQGADTPAAGSSATLDFLLRRMRHKTDFPALSDSVGRIQRVANSENESIASLSGEILKDVALTNKLLRLVNTAHYSQAGGGSISTVSRAVALIGFAGIRNMALSLVLLEHMHDKAHANLLKEEFLRSLMAGSLASELRATARDGEEAFIGAMFQNLGRLLTEFYFPEEARAVRNLRSPDGSGRGIETEAAASFRILGLSFEDLGLGVAKAWGLPEGLQRCMRRPPAEVPSQVPGKAADQLRWAAFVANEVTDVILQAEPAQTSQAIARVADRYARVLGVSSRDMQAAAVLAQQRVAELAGAMGLQVQPGSPMRRLLAPPGNGTGAAAPADSLTAHELHATRPADEPAGADATREAPAADAAAMLAAGIQDITNTMVEDFKLNEVLRMILETMLRALGFQRIVFCLRDPRTETLTGRFGLGQGVEGVTPHFRVALRPSAGTPPDLFTAVCLKGADTLISDATVGTIAGRLPAWYTRSVNAPAFLLLPLLMKGAPFALIYADKSVPGGIELGEKELSLLRTLRNQAVMAFKQSS